MFQVTRRRYLALAGAVLATSCEHKKGGGFPGYALVATAGENSLAVVDLTTFHLHRQIELGAGPTAILTGGTAGQSYALTPQSGSVHIISADLKRIGSRQLARDLIDFRLLPDRQTLVAVSAATHQLFVVDTRNLQTSRRLSLSVEPAALETSPEGLVAVSSMRENALELIDLRTGKQMRREIAQPGKLRFRADGKLLLAASANEQCLTALETSRLETVVELPLAMRPDNLCFNADQGQLFISGAGLDAVAIVFPYNTIQVEQTVLAGRDPGAMACSADPAYLFIASASGNDVSILNVETRKLVGIVEVGAKPSFVTTTPDSQYALVLDQGSGDMAVIHIPAIRSSRAPSGSSGYTLPRLPASLFTLIPVGSKPVFAAVVTRSA